MADNRENPTLEYQPTANKLNHPTITMHQKSIQVSQKAEIASQPAENISLKQANEAMNQFYAEGSRYLRKLEIGQLLQLKYTALQQKWSVKDQTKVDWLVFHQALMDELQDKISIRQENRIIKLKQDLDKVVEQAAIAKEQAAEARQQAVFARELVTRFIENAARGAARADQRDEENLKALWKQSEGWIHLSYLSIYCSLALVLIFIVIEWTGYKHSTDLPIILPLFFIGMAVICAKKTDIVYASTQK